MKFADALTDAINRSGWVVASMTENFGNINAQVHEYKRADKNGSIHAPLDLVNETWNKWPEEKQVLGKGRLEESIRDVIQVLAQKPNSAIALEPSQWTPNS